MLISVHFPMTVYNMYTNETICNICAYTGIDLDDDEFDDDDDDMDASLDELLGSSKMTDDLFA